MRSKGGLKPPIPCLDDPVTKLEGVGEKTRRNLMDVRACAAGLPFPATLPDDCPDTVTTGTPLHFNIACLAFAADVLPEEWSVALSFARMVASPPPQPLFAICQPANLYSICICMRQR